MKLYLYLLIVAAVVGLGWWLREDAVSDLKAELKAAQDAHKIETERLKRVHDDVKRKLEGETRKRLDELKLVTSDGCYHLDSILPDAVSKLLRPGAGKAGP